MIRRPLAILACLGLISAIPAEAQFDDLGKIFESAAVNVARKALVGPGGIADKLGVPGETVNAEPYTVRTADGWTLVAHRYRPNGRGPAPGAMPVILCHGLSYNASFWDLEPNVSLARYLAEQGYDVWVADLRGGGLSQKWVWKLDDAPEMVIGSAVRRLTKGKIAPTGYATVDPKFAKWNLDDHIAFDVPAIVALVKHHTGAPEVTWIGHSMGGIVALAHLARHGNPGIGRLVTVGGQMTMPNGQLIVQFIRELISTRTSMLSGQLTGEELIAASRTSVHNMFFNQKNVAPSIYEALGTWATDIPAIGVLQQYMTLGSTGELLSADKRFNYARSLGNIQVPILISCGASDQFAPPVVQQYLYEHVGSTDKTLIVFGRASGFAADAGHDDALVGLNSRAQVYPLIDRWLRGERFGQPAAQPASEPAAQPASEPAAQPVPTRPAPTQPAPVRPIPNQPVQGQPIPNQPVPDQPVQGQPIPAQPTFPRPIQGRPMTRPRYPGYPIPRPRFPGQPFPSGRSGRNP